MKAPPRRTVAPALARVRAMPRIWSSLSTAQGPAMRTISFPPTEVPPGHYLMLGDNRDSSRDSRVIGFVARDQILGRASTVAFSLDYDNYYMPRADRFFARLP